MTDSRSGLPQDYREVRQAARLRRATASSARKDLCERLTHIEARLPDLRRLHLQWGDALAGRLIETLERERTCILARLSG